MIHLIVGLILLVLGAWGIIAWWDAFGQALRGLIPLMLILVGLAAVGAGLHRSPGKTEDEDKDEGSQELGANRFAQPDRDRLVG